MRQSSVDVEVMDAWNSMHLQRELVRLATEKLESETRSTLLKKEELSAKAVFDAVKEGVKLLQRSLQRWASI